MMKKLSFLISALLLLINHSIQCHEFVILIASYNNAPWYQRNLDSVLSQDFNNFEVIYMDDISTDGTFELVQEYIMQNAHILREKDIKFTLMKNTEKCYCLGNYYREIHKLPDHKIIVTLDGDDWLAHENVLSYLANVYNNLNVWLTYGQIQDWPKNPQRPTFLAKPYPREIIEKNSFRDVSWRTNHLRSFYAGLFKKIKKIDLIKDGRFIVYSEDVSYMIPMLEMAGQHFRFIDEVLYIYNRSNPLSQAPVYGAQRIQNMVKYIYAKNKYIPLQQPPY